jgi:hypothetical protein
VVNRITINNIITRKNWFHITDNWNQSCCSYRTGGRWYWATGKRVLPHQRQFEWWV